MPENKGPLAHQRWFERNIVWGPLSFAGALMLTAAGLANSSSVSLWLCLAAWILCFLPVWIAWGDKFSFGWKRWLAVFVTWFLIFLLPFGAYKCASVDPLFRYGCVRLGFFGTDAQVMEYNYFESEKGEAIWLADGVTIAGNNVKVHVIIHDEDNKPRTWRFMETKDPPGNPCRLHDDGQLEKTQSQYCPNTNRFYPGGLAIDDHARELSQEIGCLRDKCGNRYATLHVQRFWKGYMIGPVPRHVRRPGNQDRIEGVIYILKFSKGSESQGEWSTKTTTLCDECWRLPEHPKPPDCNEDQ